MNFICLIIMAITIMSCILILILFTYKYVCKNQINWNNLMDFQYHPSFVCWTTLFLLFKNNFDVIDVTSLLYKHSHSGIIHGNVLFKKIIIVFNPDYIKELLLDGNNIDRPITNYGLKNTVEDSLVLSNGHRWEVRMQKLSPLFPVNILNSIISLSEKPLRNFLQRINNKREEEWIDIHPLLGRYFYETVLEFFWEIPETSSVRNYSLILHIITTVGDLFMERAFNLFLWSNTIFHVTSKGKKFKKCMHIARKVFQKIVDKKIKNGISDKTNNEMLPGKLLRCLLEKKEDFTHKSLIDELLAFVYAAHHTSATTMSWILYEIGKNPDVQKKIQKELNVIYGNEILRETTMKDIKDMQYLKCVIKESMRLYPAVPFTARTPKVEHSFGIHVFPKNSIYLIPIFQLHRCLNQFPNPEIFQPERFLSENSADRHPFSYLPFSYGRRQCPGNKFALLQMKILLSTIMRKFSIESFPEKCLPLGRGLVLSAKPAIRIKMHPLV